MKIFVTGGGGFIGRHLTKYLLKNNYEVTIFDDLSNCTIENIESIGKINFVKGDIRDYELLEKSMRNHDLVVHLAAKISVSDSNENQEIVMDVNVNGSRNVVKSCINLNICKIIAISSAAVYGEGVKGIAHDENSDINPISVYGKSKLEMENIIKEFSKKSNLNSIILRLFNVYGYGQSDVYAGVIKKFANCAKEGKSIIIYGNGDQVRDFIHVSDVVEYIVRAIKNIDGKKVEIFNIGSGNAISINQLASKIFSIFKRNPVINYSESLIGDIKFSNSKINKSVKVLNHLPKVELVEGISKTFCETST